MDNGSLFNKHRFNFILYCMPEIIFCKNFLFGKRAPLIKNLLTGIYYVNNVSQITCKNAIFVLLWGLIIILIIIIITILLTIIIKNNN